VQPLANLLYRSYRHSSFAAIVDGVPLGFALSPGGLRRDDLARRASINWIVLFLLGKPGHRRFPEAQVAQVAQQGEIGKLDRGSRCLEVYCRRGGHVVLRIGVYGLLLMRIFV
jgi:hypothetical protein